MFSSKKIIFATNNANNFGNCDSTFSGMWRYIDDPQVSGRSIWHPIDPQSGKTVAKAFLNNRLVYSPPVDNRKLYERYVIQLVDENRMPVNGFQIFRDLNENISYTVEFSKSQYDWNELVDGSVYALRYSYKEYLVSMDTGLEFYGPWSCWYYTEFYPLYK